MLYVYIYTYIILDFISEYMGSKVVSSTVQEETRSQLISASPHGRSSPWKELRIRTPRPGPGGKKNTLDTGGFLGLC